MHNHSFPLYLVIPSPYNIPDITKFICIFEKSNLDHERQERLPGYTGGEYDYVKIRRGLVKFFPDHNIQWGKSTSARSSVSGCPRPLGHARGRGGELGGYTFKPRGDRGRYVTHETE